MFRIVSPLHYKGFCFYISPAVLVRHPVLRNSKSEGGSLDEGGSRQVFVVFQSRNYTN
jgi:hypothetical protein